MTQANFAVVPAPVERADDKLGLIARAYPDLATPDKPECYELLKRAQLMSLPINTPLASKNEICQSFVLLLDGCIRVFQLAEDGRKVTLYRLTPGDICMMSVHSLVNGTTFNASAECETPIKAIMLSASDFHEAMSISEKFRRIVLSSLTNSTNELLATFYEMAFQRMDMRLACLLGRLFERAQSDTLQITHQELAQEMGTTREVVSRVLKQFEQQGCISLSRGHIHIEPGQGLPGLLGKI